ncbi:MAG: hypothetical protein CVV18_03980 [Gammaproteobacteria bacterium HGW-Gammaproteobacteria-8]|nr:MAG: hypothetical protein CVV18_03980 [Gammaproteobacteria bacterium HGW-Gammaproteobacteria-8]
MTGQAHARIREDDSAQPLALCLLLVCMLVLMSQPIRAQCTDVDLDVATLRSAIEGIEDYDIDATTNQPRFVAEFLFALAAQVRARGMDSFRVLPQRYFEAWQQATGKSAGDAPVGMQRVLEFDQRFVVELDPALELKLPEGLALRRALAARIGWPERADGARYYSYADTSSDPDLLLRQASDIRYLLLDFGDFIAYEQVDGISGKPTSGGLGALFKLLGMGDLRSTRMAIAADGTQVNRTRVAKLFTFTALALVQPDGRAERGIPDNRPDLAALADRLELDYTISTPAHWPALCD